jgi:hypothetical protein
VEFISEEKCLLSSFFLLLLSFLSNIRVACR